MGGAGMENRGRRDKNWRIRESTSRITNENKKFNILGIFSDVNTCLCWFS